VIVRGRSGKRSSSRRSKRRRTTERVSNNGRMDKGASGSVKRRWRRRLLLPGSTAPSAASLGASESSDRIGVEIEPCCASLRRNVGRIEKRLVGERVGELGKRRRMRGRSGGNRRRRRSRVFLGLQTQGHETLSPTCRIFLCHHRPCTREIQTLKRDKNLVISL